MSRDVRVAFASGSRERNSAFIETFARLGGDLPLYVVSEFAPPAGRWIPYHASRSIWENYQRCRSALKGKRVRLAAVLAEPRMPYRKMTVLAVLIGRSGLLVFNENLNHFRLHPRCFGAMLRHAGWRMREFFDREVHPGGATYTFLWRLRHPRAFGRPLAYLIGLATGWLARLAARLLRVGRSTAPPGSRPEGVSIVICGFEGQCMEAGARIRQESHDGASEVIFVGAADGRALIREINRAAREAVFSRLCILPASAKVEPGALRELGAAFETVPDLFCATPCGLRFLPEALAEGGIRATAPLAGEGGSYVLGSGCGLWSTEKLLALGGLDEGYATVEFALLDAGLRAWRRGWASVELAGAGLSPGRLREQVPESRRDALRFLVAGLGASWKLWKAALDELNRLAAREDAPEFALPLLRASARAPLWVHVRAGSCFSDEEILGLARGAVRVFPGRGGSGRPPIVVASPYLPFPLSHGGAVRMYNLMRRAAADWDQILVSFAESLEPPAAELLEICAEIVLVERRGSHSRPATPRPDTVEEFDSPAFRAALRQTVRKWRPFAVQLEYTQMAQYVSDCAPARTILVEHDITFELYEQLLRVSDDFDVRREARKWRRFEKQAWRSVDCVVVMSERDRALVRGAPCRIVPNGVDLERFRPSEVPPEPGRLLFIGSFAHLPNLLAVEFFLKEVWPRLASCSPQLHIIAGRDYEKYLEHYRDRVEVQLDQPGVEVEGFVGDVRPAYRRAAVVIAPLVVSAGTNIKVLEALAMGKAVVSTPAGIHGLELEAGREVLVASDAPGLASAIARLLESDAARGDLERAARAAVESRYGWDGIAEKQRELYEALRTAERLTVEPASRRRRAAVRKASARRDPLEAQGSRG